MKSLFQTKTFWVNLLIAVPTLLDLVGDLGIFQAMNAPVEIIALILAIVNVILRVVTKEPVTVSPMPLFYPTKKEA